MSVLHPGLLAAGLAAIAIPIIIHLLLRRRRKPIKWAAMRFLIEAYQKQRRKLKLQQWLLLIARCLLVALIGVALARPLLDRGGLTGGAGGRLVYLVIDNSIASGLRNDAGGTSLDRHKVQAADVLGGLGPGDQAALVTLAGPAEGVVLPASADPAAVRRLVEALEPQDSAADLRRALELVGNDAQGAAETDRQLVVVLLSDFLEGSVDLSAPLPGAFAGIENIQIMAPMPRAAAPGNVQVVALEPTWDDPSDLRPGQASVTLRRSGEAGEALSVAVRIWSRQSGEATGARSVRNPVAEGTVRFARGEAQVVRTFPLDKQQLDVADEQRVVLVAEIDPDALPGDDQRRVVAPMREALRVGVVAQRRFGAQSIADLGAPQWFRFAMTPTLSVPIEIIDIGPAAIDAPRMAQLDAVIVAEPHLVQGGGWALLREFVDGGGLVLLCPPAEANIHLWAEGFEEAFDTPFRLAREAIAPAAPLGVRTTDVQTSLFRMLSGELGELLRPVTVSKVLPLEGDGGGATTLLALEDGAPWLVAARVGGIRDDKAMMQDEGGLLVYMASPPDPTWTNLPLMPLMVPMVQEVLRQGVASGRLGVSTVVAGRAFVPPGGATELALSLQGEVMRRGTSSSGDMTVRRAGVWRGTEATGRHTIAVAANPDVDGARTGVIGAQRLRAWLAGATGQGAEPGAVRWLDAEREDGGTEQRATSSPFDLALLIGVLGLALLEMGLARWASHAGPWRSGTGSQESEAA